MAAANEPRAAGASGAPGTYTGNEDGLGWLFFAGTVLGLMGIMRIIDSIWAFRYDGVLPGELQDAVLGEDLNTYAWIWLGVGIVLILSSFLIFQGSEIARWIGIAAAAIAVISAFTWMPYYPIWSLAYVVVGILVIYALACYGGRQASP